MRKFLIAAGLLSGLASAAVAQVPRSTADTLAPAKLIAAPAAKTAAPAAAAAPAAGLSRLTAADAEAWLDGYVPYALKRGGVAGAVVVVVKDGKVLVEKGYGVADTKTGAPVDPKTTMFRPGSVSKLFTWTAVMQQVEAGKIDLDADINKYLDFKIPPFEGKPLTMRNVMTHTTGFEETVRNLLITDQKNIPTLEHELKRWVPTRIFAPGSTPAYSNYGAALAGYVVQRVAGQPFDAYVADRIFKPLGMTHSSFSQPLSPALAPFMSKGYNTADGEAKPYELIPMAPAGSLASSGDDMAKFMIAHLSNGGPILSPATTAQMHDFRYPVFGPLNAMALGFFEERINGRRGIGHGGDTGVFHSHLTLFPDANVGLYVSLNSAGKDGASGSIRNYLYEGFADRYLPATTPAPASTVDAKTAAAHAAMMASHTYPSTRGSFTNFLGVAALVGQAKITVNDDGTISPSSPLDYGGAPRRYRETAPYVWDQVGGHGRIGAVVKDGDVTLWSISEYSPAIAFMTASPLMSSALLFPLLGAGLGILLITALGWPVTALVRRRYGASFPLAGSRATAYRVSRVAALLGLLALGGWAFVVGKFSGDISGLVWLGNNDGFVIALQALTVLAFLGGLLVALWNLWVVFTQSSGWFGKLWSVLLVVAMLVFLWTFYAFHMINFSLNY